MVFVQPETKGCSQQRRDDHRPADNSHHAKAEPDALTGIAPRLELARSLRAYLLGEGRPASRRLPVLLVTHAEMPPIDSGTRFPTSSCPSGRSSRARPGSET